VSRPTNRADIAAVIRDLPPVDVKALDHVTRVLLFADFGEGPNCYGEPRQDRGVNTPWALMNDRQRAAQQDARRWWLVECESAAAGRKVIRWSSYAAIPTRFGKPLGRILDSGTNEARP